MAAYGTAMKTRYRKINGKDKIVLPLQYYIYWEFMSLRQQIQYTIQYIVQKHALVNTSVEFLFDKCNKKQHK